MEIETERKEIEKYVKFFSLKLLQIITESRSGEIGHSKCKPNSMGTDWFNLSIPNTRLSNDIMSEVKRIYGKKLPGVHLPFCLNIYLKPADRQSVLMESWLVEFNDVVDQSVKGCYTVYNRLAVLLKSTASLSRVLPCYRISRQTHEGYNMYCEISIERRSADSRNEEFKKTLRVANVGTPFGTMALLVYFRTKFGFNFSLSDSSVESTLASVEKNLSAFTLGDCLPHSDQSVVDEIANAAAELRNESNTETVSRLTEPHLKHDAMLISSDSKTSDKMDSDASSNKAAFVPSSSPTDLQISTQMGFLPELPSTPPFISFLQEKMEPSNFIVPPKKETMKIVPCNCRDSAAREVDVEDDFVLVELHPAFAVTGADAGSLYRQCQTPYQLDMLDSIDAIDVTPSISVSETFQLYRHDLDQFEQFYRNLDEIDQT